MPKTLVRLVALSFLLVIARNAQAEQAAELYSKQGSVEFRRHGEGNWQPADVGQKFQDNDSVRTAASSRAALLMKDGILIRLSERSTFELAMSSQPESLTLSEGQAHFFSRKPKSFPEIRTTLVSAAIRGTEFTVFASALLSRITVLSGAVQASNSQGEVALSRGEEVIAEPGKPLRKSLLADPTEAIQWALYYPTFVEIDDLSDFVADSSEKHRSAIQNLREGKLDAAWELFQGDSARDVMGRAVIANARGNSDEALRLVLTLPRPLPPSASLFLAGLYLSRGQVSEVEALHRAIPGDHSLKLAQQAIIDLVQNRSEAAYSKASRAIQLSSSSTTAALVMSYVQQGRFDLKAARATVESALRDNPTHPALRARYAELLLSFGDSKSALKEANAAVSSTPNDAYAQTVKGFAELARGMQGEAHASFERAIDQATGDGLPFLGLGLAKIRRGELHEGRIEIQKATHLEPARALYRSYLGKALFEEEEEALADEEFARAIALDSDDPTPYLYRTFNHLSNNRPVEALEDIETSIALNENRQVYRSRLLLDQDSSVRSSSLAQVYASLGFEDVARIEAIKSLSSDYANHSAHLLLAQSYDNGDDFIQAGLSEFFIARLLSPVNFNLVRPSSAAQVSGGEYTALFDRDIQRTAIDAGASTRDRNYGAGVLHSGTSGNWGYALNYEHTYGDGYRDNDFAREHNVYGTAQYQLTPDDTLLFDANLSTFRDGDTDVGFDPLVNDPDRVTEFQDYFVRAGFNHRFGPGNQLIGQFVYNNSHLDVSDPRFERLLFAYLMFEGEVLEALDLPTLVDQDISFKSHGVRGDLQHIYTSEFFSNVLGGGILESDQRLSEDGIVSEGEDLESLLVESRAQNTEGSRRIFNYSTVHATPWLDFHAGISYANLHLSGTPLTVPFSEDTATMEEWDPKVGLVISPTGNTTVRAAYFEVVGTAGIREFELIEPTVFSGFNQAFFDLFPGTRSRNIGIGIDQKFSTKTYIGAEALRRNIIRNFPLSVSQVFFSAEDLSILDRAVFVEENDAHLDEDVAKAYINQVWTKELTSSVDYMWSRDQDHFFATDARTHRVQLRSNYFHPSGLSFFARANWRSQDLGGFDEGMEEGDDFWIVDVGASYRLPRRHGLITLSLNNILDEDFHYLPNGLEPVILPGIGAVVTFSYNF